MQKETKTVLSSLVIDEMVIRKHLERDRKSLFGYVNIGINFNTDSNALAKEEFVIMVININGTWKLPV